MSNFELKYSTSGLLAWFRASLSTKYRLFNRKSLLFTLNIDFKKVDAPDMKNAPDYE